MCKTSYASKKVIESHFKKKSLLFLYRSNCVKTAIAIYNNLENFVVKYMNKFPRSDDYIRKRKF